MNGVAPVLQDRSQHSVLAHCPNTASSAKFSMLCYQPETIPWTLAARLSKLTSWEPCRLLARREATRRGGLSTNSATHFREARRAQHEACDALARREAARRFGLSTNSATHVWEAKRAQHEACELKFGAMQISLWVGRKYTFADENRIEIRDCSNQYI